MSKEINKIKITGYRWQDTYGNTYHKTYILINNKERLTSPITYGYGNQFEQTALDVLIKNNFLNANCKNKSLFNLFNKDILTINVIDVKRKRDL